MTAFVADFHYSFNMKPKQEEMDAIVRQMFQAIQTQAHLDSTLLVLAGDHGMNEGGNHGGSAPGETSPALVFISPKLKAITSGSPCPTSPSQDFDYYDKVEQSDLAATLAGLLGFPVPLNNLGIVLPQILHMWPKEEDRVQLLLRNALQILDIVRAKYSHPIFHGSLDEIDCQGSLSDELELACLWKEASQALNVDHAQSEPLAASAALLKVSLPNFFSGIGALMVNVVLQTCARDLEHHSEQLQDRVPYSGYRRGVGGGLPV